MSLHSAAVVVAAVYKYTQTRDKRCTQLLDRLLLLLLYFKIRPVMLTVVFRPPTLEKKRLRCTEADGYHTSGFPPVRCCVSIQLNRIFASVEFHYKYITTLYFPPVRYSLIFRTYTRYNHWACARARVWTNPREAWLAKTRFIIIIIVTRRVCVCVCATRTKS